MLFIRGINFCLEQIQAYFTYHLGLSSGIDFEGELANYFSETHDEDMSARMPASLIHEAPFTVPGEIQTLTDGVSNLSLSSTGSSGAEAASSSDSTHHKQDAEGGGVKPSPKLDDGISSPSDVRQEDEGSAVEATGEKKAVAHQADGKSSSLPGVREEEGGEEKVAVKDDGKARAVDEQDDKSPPKPLSSSAASSAPSSTSAAGRDWTAIPEIGITDPIFAGTRLEGKQHVDSRVLRLGLTWGQIVNSTYDEFNHFLRNNLKKESLTESKMLVLARFARQLSIIKAWGIKILNAREQLLESLPLEARADALASFKANSVDTWIYKLTVAAKTEAELLLQATLEANKRSLLLGFSYTPGAGNSEDMIFACNHVLKSFYQFILEHDNQVGHVSMMDYFPKHLASRDPLSMSFTRLTQYLMQNWFSDGMFEAHKTRSAWLKWDQYTYEPLKAATKRTNVTSLLQILQGVVSNAKKKETESAALAETQLWSGVIQAVHSAASDASFLTTQKSMLVTYSGFCEEDRLPVTYSALHGDFVGEAEVKTVNGVVSGHRHCKF